jgi:pyruvate/2-oxoglutarate dehydrogenase complex dihydrolipoamide acyltransferase (E2) component
MTIPRNARPRIPQTAAERAAGPRPAVVPPHTPSAGPILEPWRYRSWVEQAARLYAHPEARRLALLHHLDLKLTLTSSPETWLMLQDLATCLEQEVAP